MPKKPQKPDPDDEEVSPEEAARRGDELLKRALTGGGPTPYKNLPKRMKAPASPKQREADIERRKRIVPAEQKAKPRKR